MNGPDGSNKDLALRLQRIEDKLNLVADFFHIGKPMRNLDDIERLADKIVKRGNLNRKKRGGDHA